MFNEISFLYYSPKDESDVDTADHINERDSNGPEMEPEFEPDDENEEFINKSLKNNNLINNIKVKKTIKVYIIKFKIL